MSDHDPLQQLASFGTGGPVSPLAPAEVRRLGDRRRSRRRALAGVAGSAAFLAVAIPAGLYAARDDAPAPAPPTSPVLTAIPDDFALDHGFGGQPGDTTGPTHDDLGIIPVDLCGEIGWQQPVDRLAARRSGEATTEHRELALFRDEATAAAQVERFRERLASCTSPTSTSRDGSTSEATTTVRAGAALGDSTGWLRSDKDGPFEAATMTRVGNAVLYVSADALDADGTARMAGLVDSAASWLSARMCTFAATCADTGSADDFPLDRDAYDFGTDGTRQGPAQEVGAASPTPCGTDPLHARPVVDRLGFANLGPEFEEHRQLLLYADEQAAAEVMTIAAAAVDGCSTEPSPVSGELSWAAQNVNTGFTSATYSQGVKDAIGGTTYQLTRVGRAVLQVAWGGEGGGDIGSITAVTEELAPRMCGWSGTGCTGPQAGAEHEIDDDFPLADDFPDRSEYGTRGYRGPNRVIDDVAVTVCGKPLPDPAHRDRLLASYESAEDGRTRQLTTYADADAAVAASRGFVEAFRACPTDPGADGFTDLHSVQDLGLGGESWALLTRATMDGAETPFGSTILVVRVGRAVLVEEQGGHAGYPSADGITELGNRLQVPIAAMCAFTADNC